MNLFTNLAWYRFVEIDNPRSIRPPLLDYCLKLSIKGTILLSAEGININIVGLEKSIQKLIKYLEADNRFKDIEAKITYSTYQPFTRMLVKVKREIIAIHNPEIQPSRFTGPKIQAKELHDLYEAGEDFTILDTRNDFEIRLGRFKDSIDVGLNHFSEFPTAIKNLDKSLKSKPLVMYCTGGIRCEKASAAMLDAGFKKVYQLDGGILRYFEQCGGDYWEGECFVFDKRVALDENLEETDTTQCFNCREPVEITEQKSSKYLIGVHCPRCVH